MASTTTKHVRSKATGIKVGKIQETRSFTTMGGKSDPPISTCEEQAFVYVAKLRMSEMLWFTGDRELARRLFHEASELKKRFNDRYWMPDKKFFALGLDAKRQQIQSISSNPGHLLACGIVHKQLAQLVARRLLQDDMFSGWGVRTLSANHPAYDSYSITEVRSGRSSTEALQWG